MVHSRISDDDDNDFDSLEKGAWRHINNPLEGGGGVAGPVIVNRLRTPDLLIHLIAEIFATHVGFFTNVVNVCYE